MLRGISAPSAASLVAWKEAYQRWGALTQVVARPLAEESGDSGQEKAAQWHNFAGFLAAYGGCCAVEDPEKLPQPLTATYLNPRYVNTDPPMPLVESFMQEMVDLLVSDSIWVREKVKETLGLDLSPRLNGILFRQVHAVLSDFFDKSTGLPRPAEMFTIFVEQSIAVVQMVLNRMNEPSDAASSVDIGSLMVLYVEYVNALGKREQALRIKTSMCQLCEALMGKKSFFAFTNELRVRNRLFQALVTWTSDPVSLMLAETRETGVLCLPAFLFLCHRATTIKSLTSWTVCSANSMSFASRQSRSCSIGCPCFWQMMRSCLTTRLNGQNRDSSPSISTTSSRSLTAPGSSRKPVTAPRASLRTPNRWWARAKIRPRT